MSVLVLDVDGVVITGHPDGGRWDKDIAGDLGIDPARLQHDFFKAHWPDIEIGRVDLFERLDQAWPHLHAACDPATFVTYWFARDSRVDREVLAEVAGWRAKGGRAYLATVQEHHRARHIWTELGLSSHFDGIFYSAALGAKKPQAAFYAAVQAALPVAAPQDVLFLDDRADNVAAAADFGWRASLYQQVGDLRAALAGL